MSNNMIIDAVDDGDSVGEWFSPDFAVNGMENLEQPIEDQLRVRYLPLKGGEKLKLDHSLVLKTKTNKKTKDLLATVSEREYAKMKRVLEKKVVELSPNWKRSVKNDDGTRRIETITDAKTWILTIESAKAQMLGVLDQVYAKIIGASTLDEDLAGE